MAGTAMRNACSRDKYYFLRSSLRKFDGYNYARNLVVLRGKFSIVTWSAFCDFLFMSWVFKKLGSLHSFQPNLTRNSSKQGANTNLHFNFVVMWTGLIALPVLFCDATKVSRNAQTIHSLCRKPSAQGKIEQWVQVSWIKETIIR